MSLRLLPPASTSSDGSDKSAISSDKKSPHSWSTRSFYPGLTMTGLPKSTTAPLQRVQNAAARLILDLKMRDHVTPALRQLHWLPVHLRIKFKLCVMMHAIHTGQCPTYLADTVQATSVNPSRPGLRSA